MGTFPDGRHAIELDPWVCADAMTLRWLDIERGRYLYKEIKRCLQETTALTG
jgi:hypothetical protein